jgi:hypothetical protein
MALQLYRRHRKDCEAKRPEDSKSGQFEEGRRGWQKCACLIHASGSISGKFGRRSTGKRDWENAHTAAAGWAKAKSWAADEPLAEPEAVPAPDPPPARTTIREALEAYLDKCKGRDVKAPTLAKYKTLTNQLAVYLILAL